MYTVKESADWVLSGDMSGVSLFKDKKWWLQIEQNFSNTLEFLDIPEEIRDIFSSDWAFKSNSLQKLMSYIVHHEEVIVEKILSWYEEQFTTITSRYGSDSCSPNYALKNKRWEYTRKWAQGVLWEKQARGYYMKNGIIWLLHDFFRSYTPMIMWYGSGYMSNSTAFDYRENYNNLIRALEDEYVTVFGDKYRKLATRLLKGDSHLKHVNIIQKIGQWRNVRIWKYISQIHKSLYDSELSQIRENLTEWEFSVSNIDDARKVSEKKSSELMAMSQVDIQDTTDNSKFLEQEVTKVLIMIQKWWDLMEYITERQRSDSVWFFSNEELGTLKLLWEENENLVWEFEEWIYAQNGESMKKILSAGMSFVQFLQLWQNTQLFRSKNLPEDYFIEFLSRDIDIALQLCNEVWEEKLLKIFEPKKEHIIEIFDTIWIEKFIVLCTADQPEIFIPRNQALLIKIVQNRSLEEIQDHIESWKSILRLWTPGKVVTQHIDEVTHKLKMYATTIKDSDDVSEINDSAWLACIHIHNLMKFLGIITSFDDPVCEWYWYALVYNLHLSQSECYGKIFAFFDGFEYRSLYDIWWNERKKEFYSGVLSWDKNQNELNAFVSEIFINIAELLEVHGTRLFH